MDLRTAAPQASAAPQALIGVGQVWHRRLRPTPHEFRHDSYFLMLPMRHRRQTGCAVPRKRFGLITFADQDHGDGRPDALAWFESVLQQEGITDADGEVWLQTYPRVLGHAFKPVSFWFAHRADGSLTAIVAEVNNTFGERHCYLLQAPQLQWGQELQATKVFHVSPFCKVAGHYRFRFEQTPTHAVARIDLHDEQGPLLQTSMGGRLQAFNRRNALHAFFTTPFMTLGVVARIHWHALRLWLKRVPFFHKPTAPDRFVTR